MIQSEDYQQAMDKNITVKYIATPLKYPLKDTMSVCARISARRVEIRDIYTYNAARTFATLHNIDQFEAGIIWNAPTKRFIYISDSYPARTPNLFPHIVYGGYYTGSSHLGDWEHDTYIPTDADKFPFVYSQPTGNFVLRMADSVDINRLNYVMCEQTIVKPPSSNRTRNQFIAIASHTCKRDLIAMKTQTRYTLTEISAITNLNFTLTSDPDWTEFFPMFEPLSNTDKQRTFRYNLYNTKVPKPRLGQEPFQPQEQIISTRKRRSATSINSWDYTAKHIFDPMTDWNTGRKFQLHPMCYWTPSNFFVDDASHFFKFPYEEWEIFSEVPKTLPDYVILMHTIWQIHIEKQYNELSFPDWMAKQGQRVELFKLLRKSSLIQRVDRHLSKAKEDVFGLLKKYLAKGEKQPHKFHMQIKRIIDHLQTEVLDKILQQHFQQTKNIDTSLLDDEEKSKFATQILSNNVSDKFKYNTNDDESEESEEEEHQTQTGNTEERKSINTPRNRHKRAIPLIAPAIAA